MKKILYYILMCVISTCSGSGLELTSNCTRHDLIQNRLHSEQLETNPIKKGAIRHHCKDLIRDDGSYKVMPNGTTNFEDFKPSYPGCNYKSIFNGQLMDGTDITAVTYCRVPPNAPFDLKLDEIEPSLLNLSFKIYENTVCNEWQLTYTRKNGQPVKLLFNPTKNYHIFPLNEEFKDQDFCVELISVNVSSEPECFHYMGKTISRIPNSTITAEQTNTEQKAMDEMQIDNQCINIIIEIDYFIYPVIFVILILFIIWMWLSRTRYDRARRETEENQTSLLSDNEANVRQRPQCGAQPLQTSQENFPNDSIILRPENDFSVVNINDEGSQEVSETGSTQNSQSATDGQSESLEVEKPAL